MSEIEVTPAHSSDPAARRVGVLVSVVGLLLSVVTIASHRAHTNAVIHRTESNDQWSYYQAKRIRESSAQTALSMLDALAPNAASTPAAAVRHKLELARQHYGGDARRIRKSAESFDRKARTEERRALRYDVGEGLLELGLVLCSLYFIARRKFFPILGLIASILGTAIGAWGLLLR